MTKSAALMEIGGMLGWAMAAYGLVMVILIGWAHRKVETAEDFVVAGRRLGTPLATATLLATWFGAGTLLTAADEVAMAGLSAATLDPLGAGLCLLLAGGFFARPLWRMKLTTLPEVFERRFGPFSQQGAALLMIPPHYTGSGHLAVAYILELFLGFPSPRVFYWCRNWNGLHRAGRDVGRHPYRCRSSGFDGTGPERDWLARPGWNGGRRAL